MNRFPLALAILVAVAWPSSGRAVEITNYDAVALAPPNRTLQLDALPPGETILHQEPRLGLPTFVWAGFAPQVAMPPGTTEQIAWSHLERHASLYRLNDLHLAQLRLASLHDTGRGAIVAAFAREVDGIEVFKDRLRVVLDRKGQLVALTGFVSSAEPAATKHDLGQEHALALAASDLGADIEAAKFTPRGVDDAGFARYESEALDRPARIRPVWFHLPEALFPAWHIELETPDAHAALVIDAVEGRVLWRRNLVQDVAYRVWADPDSANVPFDGPQGSVGSPHPDGTPNAWQAPHIGSTLVELASGPISTNDPWLAPGARETIGNNVDAYTDHRVPDGRGFNDARASTTGTDAFDRAYDVGLDPDANEDQSMAVTTHLFYVTNWLHDWFYDAGFDEIAGNAQQSNYDRGGAGNDRLLAEAQDYSGLNNANMGTPADGDNPRMQMFVFLANFERRASVIAPASEATSYAVGVAGFGPQEFDATGELVLYEDATEPTSDGCQAPVNDLAGKIVLIDRGTCPFSEKTRRAQDAGAAGVIIANNEDGFAPGMSGDDTQITIGVLSVSRNDGNALRGKLGTTVQLFRELAINRDSALDTSIVAHEFTHMVTNRLIGDAAGLGNNQGGGLGEGWSDFASLLLLVRAEDTAIAGNEDFGGVYGIGQWVSSGGGTAGYYYGMRRYPYSVDFTRNPLTFKHIENDVQLPQTAPFQFGRSGRFNAEVHRTGEVWAQMMWECYVALLRDTERFTFDQARARMLELFVASLKITPNDPTFLEARDALLAAAWASDRVDYELFLQAFARRGAGLYAQGPDRWSNDHHTVTESYDAGYDLAFVDARIDDSQAGCDRDGILDAGETARLVIRLRNRGIGPLEASTATITTSAAGVALANEPIAIPPTQPLETVEIAVPVEAPGVSAKQLLEVTVVVADPQMPAPRTFTWGTQIHYDERPATSATDDVESAHTRWTSVANPAFATMGEWHRIFVTGEGHRWTGPVLGTRADLSLVSPPLEVSDQRFRIHFKHRYQFEVRDGAPVDGALIEISEDDGRTWLPVEGNAGGTIDGSGGNPLAGRAGFVGESAGWPGLKNETVDLGTRWAGKSVRVRFRVASDIVIGGPSWEIDDIAFEGLANLPFPTSVDENGSCENQAPVAVISGSRRGFERGEVIADGSASYDVDWDELTYTWTQIDGPAIEWVDAASAIGRFTAPEVEGPTPVVLRLEVSDGTLSHTATAEFLIDPVNQAPVAVARGPEIAPQGTVVQLDGTESTDAEGATLTYRWQQREGPEVELDDRFSPTPRFTAPMVEEEQVVRFVLVVDDGELESANASVSVRIVLENGAPTVTAVTPLEVAEGETLVLEAVGTDPEAQPLTYLWAQIGGTTAQLEPSGAAAMVIAPLVDADETLTFQVVASDGTNVSEPATVEVRVLDQNTVKGGGNTNGVESGCGCSSGGSSAALQLGAWAAVALALRRRRAR